MQIAISGAPATGSGRAPRADPPELGLGGRAVAEPRAEREHPRRRPGARAEPGHRPEAAPVRRGRARASRSTSMRGIPCAITGCGSPSTSSSSPVTRHRARVAGARHEDGRAGAHGQLGGQRSVQTDVEAGRHGRAGYPAAPCRRTPASGEFWRRCARAIPPFRAAVREDARVNALHRGERHEFRSGRDAALQALRLAWVSDAFLAQVLYRAQGARCSARGVPRAAAGRAPARDGHRARSRSATRSSSRRALYLLHGQVVVDGLAEIGSGAVIAPFVTIGLRAGELRRARSWRAASASGPAPRSSAPCGSARARASAPTRSWSATSRRARRWPARPRAPLG